MINQRDTRFMGGFNTQYEIDSTPFGIPLTSTAGFQYRIDTPHVVLANAVQRFQLARTQDVNIVEQSFSPFVKLDLTPIDKVRLVTGRARRHLHLPRRPARQHHRERPQRQRHQGSSQREGQPDPRAVGPDGVLRQLRHRLPQQRRPRGALGSDAAEALPTATGYEFGFRSRILPRTEFFFTYWFLDLESELVFVGDDGTTEAQGPQPPRGPRGRAEDQTARLAHVHRGLHVYVEGGVHAGRRRDPAGADLDGAGRPHRAPALWPVLQPGDALPGRSVGRRGTPSDRARLHAAQTPRPVTATRTSRRSSASRT